MSFTQVHIEQCYFQQQRTTFEALVQHLQINRTINEDDTGNISSKLLSNVALSQYTSP